MGIVVVTGGRFKTSGVFIIHRGSCVTGATSSLRELLLLPRVVCVFIRGGVVTNGGLSAAVSSSLGAASSPEAASSPRNLCHRRRFVTGRFWPTLKFSVSYTRHVASFTKQNRLPAGGSSSGEASVDSNNDGDNDSDDDSRAIPEAGPSCPARGPLAIFRWLQSRKPCNGTAQCSLRGNGADCGSSVPRRQFCYVASWAVPAEQHEYVRSVGLQHRQL